MRIIAGEFRSRPLYTPADADTTRPIPDRVKESLFAILRGHTEGATVFDAFAGTGAVGLEAISRGAARCVFVEKDKRIAAILQKNIDALGVRDRAELVIGDALGPGALARCPRPVKLVFFDPPYPLVREPVGFRRVTAQFAQLVSRLAPDGYAVLRTPWPFFLETAEEAQHTEAEPSRPKKQRRAKERDRALRDPDLAERWSRRSPRPPAGAGSSGPDFDELEEVELDEAGLDEAGLDEAGLNEAAMEELEGSADVVEDDVSATDATDATSATGGARADESGAGPAEPDIHLTKARAKMQRTEPSLQIPGARGPETHVYGSMAVHLYMKA